MENKEPTPTNGAAVTVKRTGTYQGPWTDTCAFCGREQSTHRTTFGPINGELSEQRIPCAPEKEMITKQFKTRATTARHIVFVWGVVVPGAILLIKKFTIVGWIVFGVSIVKMLRETFRIYGKSEKSEEEKKKAQEEQDERTMLYHCKRNPDGFRRLMVENFKREEEERENGNNGAKGSDTKGSPQ